MRKYIRQVASLSGLSGVLNETNDSNSPNKTRNLNINGRSNYAFTMSAVTPIALSTPNISNEQNPQLPNPMAWINNKLPKVLIHAIEFDSPYCLWHYLSFVDYDINYTPQDKTAINGSLFLEACNYKSYNVVEFLLSKGADVNQLDAYGKCGLYKVLGGDCEKIVKLLLEHGANPNIVMDNVGSLLTKAIKSNLVSVIPLLLKYGADPNILNENHENNSFYTSVVTRDNTEILELILKNTKNIAEVLNKKGKGDQQTILHRMTSCCNRENAVELLIKHGAKVNEKDEKGKTALHYAVSRSKWSNSIARCLIKHGADLFAKDNDGKTPMDILTATYEFSWAINIMNTWAQRIKLQMVLTHEYAPDSLLHRDYLCDDMFHIILRMIDDEVSLLYFKTKFGF